MYFCAKKRLRLCHYTPEKFNTLKSTTLMHLLGEYKVVPIKRYEFCTVNGYIIKWEINIAISLINVFVILDWSCLPEDNLTEVLICRLISH